MRIISIFFFLLFLGVACTAELPIAQEKTAEIEPTAAVAEDKITPEVTPSSNNVEPAIEDLPAESPVRNRRIEDPKNYTFRQLIPFDGIRPVYVPTFATIAETQDLLFDDELVLGITLEGEAKAYPISVLRFREIVNDELGGIPTLVTW